MIATEIKVVGLSFRNVKTELKPGDKVQLVPETDNKYDPNALAVQKDGELIGYVGKADPLRSKILKRAAQEPVELPVLIVNYYEKDDEKLWKSVEPGDMVQLWLRAYTHDTGDTFEEIESFTGETVRWSEYEHVYQSLDGVELIGGSTYAKQFGKEFNAELISGRCAKAWGVPAEAIQNIWEMNANTSSSLGDALHNALESVHRHWENGEKIKEAKKDLDENYSLPTNTTIKKAVLSYIQKYGVSGLPEVLVTDVKNGMAGSIDLLLVDEDKNVELIDFKTSVIDDDKKIIYNHQLSWYGKILENFGYKVKRLELRMWDGEKWTSESMPMLEVKI